MAVILKLDDNGQPVQILGADDATAPAALTVSGTTGRVALPTGAEIVEVSSSGAIHIAFGDSSVAATTSSRFFPSGGMAVYKILPRQTHIAAIYAAGTSSAVLTVGKMM